MRVRLVGGRIPGGWITAARGAALVLEGVTVEGCLLGTAQWRQMARAATCGWWAARP